MRNEKKQTKQRQALLARKMVLIVLECAAERERKAVKDIFVCCLVQTIFFRGAFSKNWLQLMKICRSNFHQHHTLYYENYGGNNLQCDATYFKDCSALTFQ